MDIVVYGDDATMFRDEELEDISEIERGPNFVEVQCLLKSQNHGEQVGNLKVFLEGNLKLTVAVFLTVKKVSEIKNKNIFHLHLHLSLPCNFKMCFFKL
ncbi:unnamed protein product [Camellia sinensis]